MANNNFGTGKPGNYVAPYADAYNQAPNAKPAPAPATQTPKAPPVKK